VERVRGISERLAERGYDLMLFDVETPGQRTDALRDFAQRDRVDGLSSSRSGLLTTRSTRCSTTTSPSYWSTSVIPDSRTS
jgi:hypothetical protein